MGSRSAPGKKTKINAKTLKIHRKYVDLNDFHPPQKAPEKRPKRTIKRHLSGSPNLDFDRFRLDPPFLCGLGSETVPKLIENRFQNGHQNGPKNDIKKNHEKTSKTTPQNWTLFPTCLISEREARLNTKPVSIKLLHVVAKLLPVIANCYTMHPVIAPRVFLAPWRWKLADREPDAPK